MFSFGGGFGHRFAGRFGGKFGRRLGCRLAGRFGGKFGCRLGGGFADKFIDRLDVASVGRLSACFADESAPGLSNRSGGRRHLRAGSRKTVCRLTTGGGSFDAFFN